MSVGGTGNTHKYKLWDKNTALTNLAKHYGLLKELIEHSGTDGESIGKIELVVVYPEGTEERKRQEAKEHA